MGTVKRSTSDRIELILVRTNYDDYTRITHGWSDTLTTMLHVLHDLDTQRATADGLRSVLRKTNGPALIGFYGHGEKDHLIAQESTNDRATPRLISVGGDGVLPTELARHNVYAVACWAGAKLSHALHRRKCSFIGYKYEFMFPEPPFEDDFMRIVNEAFYTWATGMTAREVGQQLRHAWRAQAEQYRAMQGADGFENFQIRAAGLAAMSNREALISLNANLA